MKTRWYVLRHTSKDTSPPWNNVSKNKHWTLDWHPKDSSNGNLQLIFILWFLSIWYFNGTICCLPVSLNNLTKLLRQDLWIMFIQFRQNINGDYAATIFKIRNNTIVNMNYHMSKFPTPFSENTLEESNVLPKFERIFGNCITGIEGMKDLSATLL